MLTQPKELFIPRAAGSNVSLSCYGITCRMFGTTATVSALPGEEARSFTVHLPDGQDRGLIAVAVHYPLYDNKMVWIGYILEFTRNKNGLVHVDLDHPWVPEGAQIVQVDYLGIHLTDAASGDRFTTHEDTAKKHGLSYVPNGNLLMRCLAGLATLDEVRAAAITYVEEKIVREQIVELEACATRMEARIADLGMESERLKKIEAAARDLFAVVSPDSCEAIPVLKRACKALGTALDS